MRDRRVLIVGATVVATLLILARGLPAWRTWVRDARAKAAESAGVAEHAAALVRVAGPMRDSLVARNARYLALAPTLLAGRSSAAAGATLASVVSGAATEAGVKLGAVQIRTTAATSPSVGAGVGRGSAAVSKAQSSAFLRVRVQSDVIGDVRGLTRLLLALERGPLRLVVRELSVTQSDPVGAADRPETLRAELTVEGLAVATRDDTTATR